ncbi:MAG TPA: VWA domain-containing protein [Bryobacterales bacterium]|nr:VWA domain-containing protein [Bryobacterales bacterium]
MKLLSDPPLAVAMAYVPRLRSLRWAALLVFPVLVWVAAAAPAQADEKVNIAPRPKAAKREAPKPGEGRFTVDVNTVLVNVSVVTPMGQQVTGLEKEHFRVFEDKQEQIITHFGSEDAPLSMGIIFDCSGSMGQKLLKSRQAVSQFFKTANPDDEFFLIEFSERPELVVPFTVRLEEIQNRLTFTQAKGRTALLDAIYLGLNTMKQGKNPKKALLIISDGGDNNSRYTEREIRNLVKEADVEIYAIGIYEPMSARGRTAEELNGPSLLTEVAEQTGGRQFAVENLNELPDIAAQIGIVLRNQYVLGYTPSNLQKDGKWRRIEVKLKQPRGMPPLRVFAKHGYYAPAQ